MNFNTQNELLLVDTEKPGILVITRCINIISEYLGQKQEKFLKEHTYHCKRLYSKSLSMKNSGIEKICNLLKQNKSQVKYNSVDSFSVGKIRNVVSSIYKNRNLKLNEEFLIELLIPYEKRVELNEFNTEEVFKMFYNKLKIEDDQEFRIKFKHFLLRGENYIKYSKLLSMYKIIIDKEDYYQKKADKYLNNYEKYLTILKEGSSVLKN